MRVGLLPAAIGAGVFFLVLSGSAIAQEPDDGRNDDGGPAAARAETAPVDRLRAHLREHPQDAEALRLLASTLRSLGDPGGAREAFERALAARPGDHGLRLDYGRMLVDLRAGGRAREVLAPVADDPTAPPSARAAALIEMGRVALRDGRVRTAEDELLRGLGLVEDDAEGRRLLREARRERSHWLRAETDASRDDQPLRSASASVHGGLRVQPWLTTEFRAGAERLESGSVDERLVQARASARARWDLLDLEGEVWGGGFRRAGVDEGDWSGGAALGYRGPGGVTLRGRARRAPYLRTAASLEAPVTVTSVEGAVERTDPWRWGGGIRYGEERFSTGVRTEEAAARILAPLLSEGDAVVRGGYAFRTADSDASGFQVVRPIDPTDGAPLPGRYDPVYTPLELRVHSLLLDGRYVEDGGTRLAVETSWGFSAREHRPVLFSVIPGAPEAGIHQQFRPCSFTPWHVEVRGRLPISPRIVVDVEAGYRRTAFRSVSLIRLGGAFYGAPGMLP